MGLTFELLPEKIMKMENLDILTHDGIPAGYSSSRSEAHKKGLYHRSIHLWIITPSGELLIQKRSMNKSAHPGLWDISCAGHVESGDTTESTVIKEAKEELGLDLSEDKILYCRRILTQNIHKSGEYIDNEFIDVFLTVKDVRIESLIHDENEVSDIGLIPLKSFKEHIDSRDSSFTPHYDEYTYMFGIPEIKKYL